MLKVRYKPMTSLLQNSSPWTLAIVINHPFCAISYIFLVTFVCIHTMFITFIHILPYRRPTKYYIDYMSLHDLWYFVGHLSPTNDSLARI